jgi:acyl-CoA reductase-like NAD-dependent aldehyde dehydrogenase
MPWNFPLWQAMRFAAPALMPGNVGLLKHASNVPQTAMFMQDLFSRAGFPAGTFQTLLVSSGRIEAILRDDRVTAATLTGSGPAGQSVAAIAGSEIKKVVLELGGSAPSEQQRKDVEELVDDAAAKDARVLCGGKVQAGPGWYYPPTVLAGITDDMRVHSEEVFGPTATRYRVADIDAAIALANGTEFGLGANAWTDDEQERARFTRGSGGRPGFHQRQRHFVPAAALRRHQDLRPWAGARGPRHPRVLQHQVSVGWRPPGQLSLPGPIELVIDARPDVTIER